MAQLKTRPTEASVDAFIDGVEDETRRAECRTLITIMQRVTGAGPVMWGPAIVGFGSYHYRYASGREGDWMLTGFSPRKRELSVYLMAGLDGLDGIDEMLARLGPHRASSGSCLYLRRLSDVDLDVLEALVRASVEQLGANYPTSL